VCNWLTWRYAPRTPGAAHRRVHLGSAAMAVTALAAFAAAVIEAGSYGFDSPLVLGSLVLLAVATFARLQTRAAEPMLPLALFRDRRFTPPRVTRENWPKIPDANSSRSVTPGPRPRREPDISPVIGEFFRIEVLIGCYHP
jgi:hypothetical protein